MINQIILKLFIDIYIWTSLTNSTMEIDILLLNICSAIKKKLQTPTIRKLTQVKFFIFIWIGGRNNLFQQSLSLTKACSNQARSPTFYNHLKIRLGTFAPSAYSYRNTYYCIDLFLVYQSISFLRTRVISCSFIHSSTQQILMSIIHRTLFQPLGVHQGKNKTNALSSGRFQSKRFTVLLH